MGDRKSKLLDILSGEYSKLVVYSQIFNLELLVAPNPLMHWVEIDSNITTQLLNGRTLELSNFESPISLRNIVLKDKKSFRLHSTDPGLLINSGSAYVTHLNVGDIDMDVTLISCGGKKLEFDKFIDVDDHISDTVSGIMLGRAKNGANIMTCELKKDSNLEDIAKTNNGFVSVEPDMYAYTQGIIDIKGFVIN